MKRKTLTMLGVGDLILENKSGDFVLSLAASVLKSGDVVVGQGEVLFTDRGYSTFADMYGTAGAAPPQNMKAIASAGFNVITLAGNHTWDQGAPAIEDTIAGFGKLGVAVTGAGMNLDEARTPAILERDGVRFGFLSYSCVGPMGEWAGKAKPGCAFVHVIAHYEMNYANLGGTPDVYTFAEPHSLKDMIGDVQKLRPLCDILVVSFHKGIIIPPDRLAMYDQQVPYAAIDAGADLIFGHHAHILQGVEYYKGKAIFHGLSHFVKDLADRSPEQIQPFHSYGTPPFPPVNTYTQWTIIAKCLIDDGKITQVGYIPCLINDKRQPEVLKNDERGRQCFDFMDKITKGAGLETGYEWKGDEVVVHEKKYKH
jgi:poly-gamma-glutamate synthesis protein (capsule biosynthesis protein)